MKYSKFSANDLVRYNGRAYAINPVDALGAGRGDDFELVGTYGLVLKSYFDAWIPEKIETNPPENAWVLGVPEKDLETLK